MGNVLICGAGIAGNTLAYWLARRGWQATVVERSAGPRPGGNPVDVRGPAVPVARAMGIQARLREAATQVTHMSLLDTGGRAVTRVRMSASAEAVELPRADLATILHEAAREHADFVFDDTITALHQDAGGVDVTFDRLAPRRFDLVVGADGLHSAVRRLAFGPERDFVHHQGLYVATVSLGERADTPHEALLYNTPGRLLSVHPARGIALAAFIFRQAELPSTTHRDLAAQRATIAHAYAGLGWRVPQLVERMQAADDLYFDAVSKVVLPKWSRGRITLLGDAASCLSLFGDGSSLAMAGAHTLATALTTNNDIHQSLRGYEMRHRKLVTPRQRSVGLGAGMLVPKTRFGIAIRNLAARSLP